MIEEDIFRTEPDRDGRSRRYILTEKGEDLYVLLIALWQWGEEHCFETGEPGHVLVDRIGSRPLPRMAPLWASGKDVRTRGFPIGAREKTIGRAWCRGTGCQYG